MFKSTIQVTLFSLLGIVINFGVQLLIAYYFGASQDRDAYFAALTFPTYVTNLLVGSIIVIFLPTLIQFQTREGDQVADLFASRFINLFAMSLAVIVALTIVFARPLLRVTLPGFNEQQLQATIPLLRILMAGVFFTNCTNLFAAILQSRLQFIWAALAPILAAIVNCLVIAIGGKAIGISILAYGTLLGAVASFLALLLITGRKFNYQFTWNLRHESIQRIIRTILPLLIAGIVFRSTGIFERMISSNYPSGSISYLGYATLIITILTTVTTSGIATSIFPSLSKKYAENELEAFKRLLEKGTRTILFLIIPLSVVLSLFGTHLVEMMFQRGEFTATDSKAIGLLLMLFVGSLIGNSLGSIVVKVFYITGRTRLSSLLELVGMLSYVIPAFIVGRYFPYQGLAVVSSASAIISILISIFAVNRLLQGIRLMHILKGCIVALAISFPLYAGGYWIYTNWLNFNQPIPRYVSLVSLLGLASVLYLVIMIGGFKVTEFQELFQKFYRKVR